MKDNYEKDILFIIMESIYINRMEYIKVLFASISFPKLCKTAIAFFQYHFIF